ncbi:Transmembrane secretion effector [Actinokineospora alba]|uniref:Transmembrane secretion effector n=1 Tax=Actinokineospora alba TaxID=504798 RepID=A0A1H0U997_9PSEU|nr:MFS transporter [Actinokineospora alba]TDP65252.1 transmembrane secretion effector [Actinokineospora alba]SDH58034.1 Transmembrane secretion effector [Actinokineospora alba]SDP62739.1 Transmembrane secretion effector [Actinokineospora alba]
MFWRYWSAMTISNLGTAVTTVALPLAAVTTLGASAFEVSLVTAASYLAWLVIGLPAGVIVQRLPLRETQVAMDLIRAVAIGSVPVAWWLDRLTLTHLVVTALVISLANVLFDVGNVTFLPSIVSREELTARNSLVSGTHSATSLGGPSLAGLVIQVLGAVPTLLIDTVSFLASAVLLRGLPKADAPREEGRPGMAALIREGWRFVIGHPVMRTCMFGATSINLANGALMALIPVYLIRDLLASPAMVGLLIAADGAGSLLGAALAPLLVDRLGSARAIMAASFGGGLLALLMPLGTGVWGMALFALANVGFGMGVVVFSIGARTHRQVASPPELLSRVVATVRFVSWGAIPLGAIAGGVLASLTDTRTALLVACGMTLLAPALLWFSKVRHLRELADEPVPA